MGTTDYTAVYCGWNIDDVEFTGMTDCFGDINGDNSVDLADLTIMLSHYGITSGMQYEDGDLNGDGDVDLGDLTELLAVYGTLCE
jgi:hypothetical protein